VTDAPRYAIYFVPPADGAFYRWGASLLGYDCHAGNAVAHPRDAGLPEDWAALTQAPRRYGFHATLVAPFRLAQDYDGGALLQALAGFCHAPREIPEVALVVRALGSFIAAVPGDRNAALDRLAGDCVGYFNRFRAPLTEADQARQADAPLSERERANLARWGYPYVFEDFRFHMTLTGPVADERRAPLADLLSRLLARCADAAPLRIDRTVLMRQGDEGSPFRVVRASALRPREAASSP